MTQYSAILFFIVGFFSLNTPVNAQEFSAGKETKIEWEGTANKLIKVYLPSNYKADKKWPVLIYFHGTFGFPDTALMQTYTGRKDFIIIGMDYFIKGHMNFNSNEELSQYALKEFHNAQKALSSIKGKVSYDPEKIILSGVSKGGWVSTFISELKLDAFAGAAVFIGGVLPGKRKIIPVREAGKPVYIGDGEKDANFYPSFACIEHFKKLKAKTTFEYYDGIGHQVPASAPLRFTEWLNLFRPDNKINTQEWFNEKVDNFRKEGSLKAYRDIKESPYLNNLTIEQKKSFTPILREIVTKDKNFAQELKAYNTFFAIINIQSKASFPKDWQKTISLYEEFFKEYEGTEFANRAKHHYEAAKKNLKLSLDFYNKRKTERKVITEDPKESKGLDINSGRSSIIPDRR